MHVVVLGSAAGGGLPQWNCNCENCQLVRIGADRIKARTQSSLAVSRNGHEWFLLNCSPDLRQQITNTPRLWPNNGVRHSPIAGAVITNGDVDHVAGLLNLREGQPLVVHGTQPILETLAENSIMRVLSPEHVCFLELPASNSVELMSPSGASGIRAEVFPVPGKPALYVEGDSPDLDAETAQTVGLRLEADGKSFFYIPGCARVTERLRKTLNGCELLFWDGTLWQDDEMIKLGVGKKTGRRMGHLSMDGPDGSIQSLADIDIGRRIFVHINNTNPVLREDSVERAVAEKAGWAIAYDGMELRL